MNSRPKADCPGAVLYEEKLFLAILKTADGLSASAESFFKENGLTSAQYNVLRILRGAEPNGLPCSTIAERMISRDPDMTRLLDRMEKRNLITRERQTDDRRVVKARVSSEGLKILKKLDTPIRELHQRQFAHMSATRIKELTELLAEVVVQEPESGSRAMNQHTTQTNSK
jgi:DNA-binding MarR family transcriptional regulator